MMDIDFQDSLRAVEKPEACCVQYKITILNTKTKNSSGNGQHAASSKRNVQIAVCKGKNTKLVQPTFTFFTLRILCVVHSQKLHFTH